MNNNNFPFPLSRFQLKVFGLSFVLTFVVVSLQMLGMRLSLSQIISPVSVEKEEDIMTSTVVPRLHAMKNTYSIKEQSGGFIQTAEAALPLDEANAYVVVDYDTGKIIAEKNSSSRYAIASLTKVMTAVVALDLADPDEKFVVSQNAADMIPTKIGVVPGQKLTLHELLEASLLTSANDAVEVIREGIDEKYGEEVFMRAMNEKAQFLGLKNTHFQNPQGFDGQEHYSTAQDMTILTHYALTNYPLIAEIVKKDYTKLEANADHKQFDLYNWNGLIGVYPNVSGVKIGNTDAARKTTIVTATRSGKTILVVLLGAPGTVERDLWASQLLDIGFSKTLNLSPINVTEEQLQEKYETWNYWQ